MPTPAPFTLPVRCALCRGDVTLQLLAKPVDPPQDRQTWTCPHCQKKNAGHFPFQVAVATKGHRASSRM